MTSIRVRPVPIDRALTWTRASLEQGSEVARIVGRRMSVTGDAFVIGPDAVADAEIDDESRGIDQSDADRVLGEYLLYLASMEAGALIVEDDTARKGDPGLIDGVFVEDRVIRWRDLHADPADLMRLIRRGASGYPLNAFVCGEDGKAILEREEDRFDGDCVLALASSVRGIITSVYDAESYLVTRMSPSPVQEM